MEEEEEKVVVVRRKLRNLKSLNSCKVDERMCYFLQCMNLVLQLRD